MLDNIRTNIKNINSSLLLSIISYLILTPVDSIIYIQWINSLINYKWFSGAIIFPLVGAIFFYIPTIYYSYYDNLRPENTNIAQKYLFILGCFDSMSAIASSLTIPYISIIVLIVLGKMSLPITMLLSYYILDRRYCWTHYTGLGITLFGVTLSIVPYLFKDKDTQSSNPWAIAVYILSLIPGVLSYIYKEKFLKNSRNVNMWWMNSCISFWQFIIGIATIPFLFIPLTQININPSNFGDYISRGFNCQFNGEDFYNNDRCRFSLLWLLIYQLISTLANILIFLILKHGSSMVFMVLSTLKTPITGFLGYILISSNLLYTTEAQKVHIHLVDYFSLFLIIIGSIIYNIKPENSRPINELEQRLLSNDSELDDVIN